MHKKDHRRSSPLTRLGADTLFTDDTTRLVPGVPSTGLGEWFLRNVYTRSLKLCLTGPNRNTDRNLLPLPSTTTSSPSPDAPLSGSSTSRHPTPGGRFLASPDLFDLLSCPLSEGTSVGTDVKLKSGRSGFSLKTGGFSHLYTTISVTSTSVQCRRRLVSLSGSVVRGVDPVTLPDVAG